MAQFQNMKIVEVYKTTRDAVVLSLCAEHSCNFTQGQYLTFKKVIGGEELRRSYSICSGKTDEFIKVAVKRVKGGVFSNWANSELRAGDVVQSMPPMGNFYSKPKEGNGHLLAFAGGSGITPILSIIKTELENHTESQVTLVYSNRNINTVMFKEELEDLKNLHMSRLNLIHIFTDESQGTNLFRGRLNKQKIKQLCRSWIDIRNMPLTFICGPELMMAEVSDALIQQGMKKEFIRTEYFKNGGSIRTKQFRAKQTTTNNLDGSVRAKIIVDGEVHSFSSDKNVSLLQAALQNDVDAPYACRAGICSTCKAKMLKGEAEMLSNNSLEDHEVERGFVLTCQAYPRSDEVIFDYDQGYK